jgi:hypothetical protein
MDSVYGGEGYQGWYKIGKNPYSYQKRTTWKSLETEKVSVDDGCFIPGIYRVNPYYVSSHYVIFQDRVPRDPNFVHPTGKTRGEPLYFTIQAGLVLWFSGNWWDMAQFGYEPLPLISSLDDYKQLALQKAYAKVGKADLPLGEDLGELRETIEMLRNPMSGLKKFFLDDSSRNLKLLKALVARDPKPIAKILGRTSFGAADMMASTWVELRYGLRPLFYLMQGVIEEIERIREKIWDPTKIRSVRSKLTFGPYSRIKTVTSGYGYAAFKADVEQEETFTANASVQYKQSRPNSLIDSLGLTPRFIPETMWYLTSSSFVWDWLISIGPWLETLRINPEIEILGNTVGCKYERHQKTGPTYCKSLEGGLNNWILFENGFDGDDTLEESFFDREVDVTLSLLPHFTWGRTLDLFKAIDSAALTWQKLARKIIRKRL